MGKKKTNAQGGSKRGIASDGAFEEKEKRKLKKKAQRGDFLELKESKGGYWKKK